MKLIWTFVIFPLPPFLFRRFHRPWRLQWQQLSNKLQQQPKQQLYFVQQQFVNKYLKAKNWENKTRKQKKNTKKMKKPQKKQKKKEYKT